MRLGPRATGGRRPVIREAVRARQRLRRQWFVTRLSVAARLHRADLRLDIARDVDFGPRIQVQLQPGTRNVLVLGPGSRIHGDVLIQLKGGELRFGPSVEIRRGAIFNISGRLQCEGRNVFSYYSMVHCASSVTMGECSSLSELAAILDSTHHHDGEHDAYYDNVSSAPVVLGCNVWVCNKASILMGVTVGHNVVVASNAIVNRDVPSATVAAGTPARVVADRPVGGPAARFMDRPLPDRAGTS